MKEGQMNEKINNMQINNLKQLKMGEDDGIYTTNHKSLIDIQDYYLSLQIKHLKRYFSIKQRKSV